MQLPIGGLQFSQQDIQALAQQLQTQQLIQQLAQTLAQQAAANVQGSVLPSPQIMLAPFAPQVRLLLMLFRFLL